MAINPDLLVAAPMLQDYFVDNVTAQAMANGVITCYQDNSRTTLKNWYYQSGTPGAYTYITLPNPMTLSAVGTIVDVNGNDTIPFFYPYSEDDNETFQPYYITVDNSDGQRQFTRANFPYLPQTDQGAVISTFDNVITNNVFWRNIGTLNAQTLTANPLSGLLSATLAPSQHDGFSMPDLQYIKNVNGATETITFTPFGLDQNPLKSDITPEYYINHNCTAAQAGETLKVYQMPISLHLATLQNVAASITIQAMNNGGANNQITLSIYPFYGTGVTSPSPVVEQTITLTSSWNKYVTSFVFPNIASTATLGAGGDDAYYLQIGMPLSATCNINFTKPSIYLSKVVPDNDFETYDQIDAVINSPRTGDTRFSINTFQPYGWVAANNGTIGSASSNATARANKDTWPLYNLMWHLYSGYTTGTVNSIAPMYTSAAAPVTYGASAYADFTANNQLTLPATLDRALIGTAPTSTLISGGVVQTYTASNDGGGNLLITVANSGYFYQGEPIVLTTTGTFPGNLSGTAVYYISRIASGTTMYVSTSYLNAIAETFIAYSSAGTGTQTLTSGLSGTSLGEFAHVQKSTELASHTHTFDHNIQFTNSNVAGGGTPTYREDGGGTQLAINAAGGGLSFNVTQPSTYMNLFYKL